LREDKEPKIMYEKIQRLAEALKSPKSVLSALVKLTAVSAVPARVRLVPPAVVNDPFGYHPLDDSRLTVAAEDGDLFFGGASSSEKARMNELKYDGNIN
jgi:hypothetical protein